MVVTVSSKQRVITSMTTSMVKQFPNAPLGSTLCSLTRDDVGVIGPTEAVLTAAWAWLSVCSSLDTSDAMELVLCHSSGLHWHVWLVCPASSQV